ncbi:MAG: hypothetical protein WAN36_03705, partial [Calditrichia bacterium]
IMEKFKMEKESQKKELLEPRFRLDRLLECGIYFRDLEVKPGDILGFQLQIKQNNQLVEEFPRINLVEVEVPDKDFNLVEWSV